MAKGNALRSDFKGSAKEVGHPFTSSHVGIIHMPHAEHAPAHHNDNAEKTAHNAAKNYGSIGHFIDWLRESHAYQKTALVVDDLMRKGLIKTISYLDLPRHFARELANVPSRGRVRTKDIALDSYEHD